MTTTTIQKWGNSAAVRLPAELLTPQVGLGTTVQITKKSGGVLELAPASVVPSIAELVARITPQNMHAVIDWGAPVGKEVW